MRFFFHRVSNNFSHIVNVDEEKFILGGILHRRREQKKSQPDLVG